MAINTSLLVTAPVLQEAIISKTAVPLANGTITCYQDDSRTTLKNWYYQTGSFGNYTYIALPNPLTLSAAGTICDVNGVDTLPFFYPFSELDNETSQAYYIVVQNSGGTIEFTRQNFPYTATAQTLNQVPTYENYIINNRFWRNVGAVPSGDLTQTTTIQSSTYPTSPDYFYTTLAPSQHDGFSMPDFIYLKNNNSATETITFTAFPASSSQVLTDDITPEYYINHSCISAGSSETVKAYQFPISLHVETLDNVPFTVTLQAQAESVSTNNVISMFILQYQGTGVNSIIPNSFTQFTLESGWTKHSFNFSTPTTNGLTLGSGGDDALYLWIGMPLNATCDINFTLPSFYLSETVPSNDFKTYDQIDSVINTPRTGDLRTSINTFQPFGWVAMNDGTIGNKNGSTSSNATARANTDTWPLFNLLWNLFAPYSSGSSSASPGGTNPICQMYDMNGNMIGYGPNVSPATTAISDWNSFNALALTKAMGRVLLGTVPASSLLTTYSTGFTASDFGGNLLITTSNAVNFFNGMPIQFSNDGGSLPTPLAENTIYYVSQFNGSTTLFVSTTFENAITGNVAPFTDDGSGTQTVISAITGTTEGEYGHVQLEIELAAHAHGIGSPLTNFVGTGSGGAGPFSGSAGSAFSSVASTASAGSSAGFNITQPGTFYNIYIKL